MRTVKGASGGETGQDMNTRHNACVVAAILLGVSTAQAEIINVPADYPTIQEAIDAAMDGDEIVLAPGDYFEGFDLTGTSNITIRSTDPADPDVVAATGILPALTILVSAETPTIDGLTFQHPDGDYMRVLRFVGDFDPTVSNCQFINAGIHVLFSTNATILDCTFRDIQISNGVGGALLIQTGGSPHNFRVERCRFIDIRIDEGHGTAFFITSTLGSVSFNDCDFVRNSIGFMPDITSSFGRGGVVGYLHYPSASEPALNVTINNCRFLGNRAESWDANNVGAGCALGLGNGFADENDLNVAVANCIFVGNIGCPNTVNIGGGVNSNSSWLVDSTFVANEPLNNEPFNTVMRVYRTGAEFPVSNCISRDNVSDLNVWTFRGASYSNLDGESSINGPQVGNIDADALFVRQPDPGPDGEWGTIDDDYGDLRLTSGSPCIDAADNTAVPKDITTDLDGNPRFVDDPDTPDTGFGNPPIVDMGAYEFQGASPCPWDCGDNDGNVGIVDFLALLAQWGGPGSCDFDGGGVGINDFLDLLAAWGPCP